MATPAGPRDTPSEFVRNKAASTYRTVRFVASAKGEFPEVPAAASFTSNFVLLSRDIGIYSPVPCTGGLYLFTVFGSYLYGSQNPMGVDVDIPVGGLPRSLDSIGPSVKNFPRAKFMRFLETGSFAPAHTPPLQEGISVR